MASRWDGKSCQVCGTAEPKLSPTNRRVFLVECQRCGSFAITDSAMHMLAESGTVPKTQRLAVSSWLREHQGHELYTHDLPRIFDLRYPSVGERAEKLLAAIAKEHGSIGTPFEVSYSVDGNGSLDLQAFSWSANRHELKYLLTDYLSEEKKWLTQISARMDSSLYLISPSGHDHLDSIKRQQADSKRAFWASKWGDPELDKIADDFFRPAVKQTGFELVDLSDSARAGLIDDRLRVEIRRSRFLVADLTHGNNGAYWEAGFAEGMGLPVIYTCKKKEKKESDSPRLETHFDTNHHLTVVWDPANPRAAAEELKAVIRATMPAEAVLADAP